MRLRNGRRRVASEITKKELQKKVKELETELDHIKGETFFGEGSAFKGFNSNAVRWQWAPGIGKGRRGQVLVCKKCGAKLGPQLRKTPTGLM